jgi:ankyrin repeat protein
MVVALLMWTLGAAQAPAVDAPNADGLTALMRASARGDTRQIAALLSKGADADLQAAGTRVTALMCAGYFGHVEAVKALLAKGAKADLKDASGASAADWAIVGSQDAATDVLTKAGSQLNKFLNVGVMPFSLMDKAAGKVP